MLDWNVLVHAIPTLTVGGFIGSLGTYFLKDWIDNHFKNQSEVRNEKRALAKQIIAICSEGNASNFQVGARDREHIINLANQSLVYDPKVEDLIRKYETVWYLTADIYSRKTTPPENLFFYRELEAESMRLSKEIRSVVNKWLK